MNQFDYAYAHVQNNYANQIQTWTLEDISYECETPEKLPPIGFLKQVGAEGWRLVLSQSDQHLFMKEVRR